MFFNAAFATLATAILAAATPAMVARGGGGGGGGEPAALCPAGLYSSPQCCATDVLGVADLNCATPPSVPTSISGFTGICASIGQEARCCVLPILGQAVLCEAPL